MKREQIIQMALKAGAIPIHKDYSQKALIGNENIERFAALVAAAERESWPAEMEAMERQVNILTDALAQERKAVMQLFTDPENQPTQHGTVTVEYMQREIAAEREACAKVCEAERRLGIDDERAYYGGLMADAIRARGQA